MNSRSAYLENKTIIRELIEEGDYVLSIAFRHDNYVIIKGLDKLSKKPNYLDLFIIKTSDIPEGVKPIEALLNGTKAIWVGDPEVVDPYFIGTEVETTDHAIALCLFARENGDFNLENAKLLINSTRHFGNVAKHWELSELSENEGKIHFTIRNVNSGRSVSYITSVTDIDEGFEMPSLCKFNSVKRNPRKGLITFLSDDFDITIMYSKAFINAFSATGDKITCSLEINKVVYTTEEEAIAYVKNKTTKTQK